MSKHDPTAKWCLVSTGDSLPVETGEHLDKGSEHRKGRDMETTIRRWAAAVDTIVDYLSRNTGLVWEYSPTGGGCSCVDAILSDGWTVYVTDGDAEAPASFYGSVYVCVWDTETGNIRWDGNLPTVAAVPSFLTEYGS